MRTGRWLWGGLVAAVLSLGATASYAGDVWVCTGSTADVSVSVYPFYTSYTRVNFCNLSPSTRYRVTVTKPCYGPTASIWWSWLNWTLYTPYGGGLSWSRDFTTAPGGSYYLIVRGYDLCCTCKYQVSLTRLGTGYSGQPAQEEVQDAVSADPAPQAPATWGRLKVIYR